MRRTSIRRRLLLGVAAVQILATVLATVLVAHHERRRSYAVLNAELVEHAAMVKSVIEAPDDPSESAVLHRELLTLPRHDVYVLSDAQGKAIAVSGAWRPAFDPRTVPGRFMDAKIGGWRYRLFVDRNIAMFDDNPAKRARLPKLVLVYGSPTGEVEEHVEFAERVAAGLGLAILAASMLAVSWVVRAGLRPVVQLAGHAARIDATHWEWEAATGEREAEELAPLSLSLARLVERLQAAFARERQFSADAAHEMKTAVAIVKSTLQLALERGGGAAEYRAEIGRALEDTERMQGLVGGMLQLAKIEGLAGSAQVEAGPVDAMEELHCALRRLAPMLEARRIRVDVEGEDAALCVRISAEGLNLVLMNLLENAVHYSPDGSSIQVKAQAQGTMCTLSIEDAGCGIDAASLPHIFERFYRGDRSRSRESGGAGLGLAIVQAIVHRAGGTVTAASAPGAGSVFTLTLPRGECATTE